MSSVKGAREMAARMERARDDFRHRVASALYIEAELIMADSKQNYVPVDFGVLRDSGRVSPPEWNGGVVSVTLSFGGAASAYALAVHEHISDYSPYSWRVARRVTFSPAGHGPKYLEKPLNKHARGIMGRIKARVMGGGK